jgi:hypothetical protein
MRPGGSLLEIGEAEWYGDVPAQELLQDIKAHGTRDAFEAAVGLIGQARAGEATVSAWGLAKLMYEALLGIGRVDSIDLHGSDAAHRVDLNYASALPDAMYDIVYNCGTAEHVFHIGRVLEFIHDATGLGGLMVHCFPLSGLLDHGFWTVNPVMVFCLARANLYGLLDIAVSQIGGRFMRLDPATARVELRTMAREGRLPENSWLHVVWRKASDADFAIPTQEIYTACPDPEVVEAWRAMR